MAACTSQLKALTKDQKQKAFEKARAESDFKTDDKFKECKLVLVTEIYYEKALGFIRTNFITQEPVQKALGVPWNEEVEEFWMSFLRWNISLMLLAKDGDIMAIRISRFLSYDEESDDDAIKTLELKLLMLFIHKGEAKADLFGHFRAKECLHFFGLGTNDKYKHNHLATRMLNAAVEMAKNLGVEYIKGEGSNIYSKRVYKNVGFQLLHEEHFADFEVNGVKPLQNTGENKSMRFYGLKVSSK